MLLFRWTSGEVIGLSSRADGIETHTERQFKLLQSGGAVVLAGLISQKSLVQIQPLHPKKEVLCLL